MSPSESSLRWFVVTGATVDRGRPRTYGRELVSESVVDRTATGRAPDGRGRTTIATCAHDAPPDSPLPALRTLDDLDVANRRVLVRADLNVPLTHDHDGVTRHVADDARIRAALTTLEELAHRGAAIVLVSHLGRPRGLDPALSMRPVAERLPRLTSLPVELAPGVVGDAVRAMADQRAPGQILLLENVRYEAGRDNQRPGFGGGARAAGRAVCQRRVRERPPRPRQHRGRRASVAGRGRAAAAARGADADRDRDRSGTAAGRRSSAAPRSATRLACSRASWRSPMSSASAERWRSPSSPPRGTKSAPRAATPRRSSARARSLDVPSRASLELPSDLVVADSAEPDAASTIVHGVDIALDEVALDIGPRTAERYRAEIAAAGTVFWNGPMGRFESARFAAGTAAVAEAISETPAVTVVGGGETVEALRSLGEAERRHARVDRRRRDARAARGSPAAGGAGAAGARGGARDRRAGRPGPQARALCLVVMDGWGIAPPGPSNAISAGTHPDLRPAAAFLRSRASSARAARPSACRLARWATPRSVT